LVSGSQQQILRRLQLLYHHGYLERPRIQLEYYHHGGSHHIAYGLGNKGAALFCLTVPELNWNEKNNSIKRMFLEHALFVSDVMVALERACRVDERIRLLTDDQIIQQGERPKVPWKVQIQNRAKLGVIPDRVFALEYPGQNGNPERAYFFLEADRGTMPVIRKRLSQSSFYRKLLAYEATWSQKIHEKRFGFHRFRVLTVTTSAARMKSLTDACSQLKQGHGLFLFADRSILEKPDEILSSKWQTGNGDATTLVD
jgi:hypothetical protein